MKKISNLKVSVIIPIYNTEEKFLKYNLNNLLEITENSAEFIMVDDGSKQYIEVICKEYEKKDKRFKYYKKENSGVSDTRNFGIEKSVGKYIIFLDADDYFDINTFNKIDFNNEMSDITIFDYARVYDGKKDKIKKLGIEYGLYDDKRLQLVIERLVASNILNSIHSKVYKASIIKNNNVKFPSKVKIGEDAIFNSEYFKYCSEIAYTYGILLNYRVYGTSSVRKFPISRFDDLKEEIEHKLRLYECIETQLSKEVENKMYVYFQNLLFMNILNSRLSGIAYKDIFKRINSDKIFNMIIKYANVRLINKLKMNSISKQQIIILNVCCAIKKMKGLI